MLKLSDTDKNGVSLRDHLEQVFKSTGIRPAELDAKPIPLNYAYIVSIFSSLNKTRGDDGISFSEIESYSNLYQMSLDLDELHTLELLDNVYIDYKNAKAIAEQKIADMQHADN